MSQVKWAAPGPVPQAGTWRPLPRGVRWQARWPAQAAPGNGIGAPDADSPFGRALALAWAPVDAVLSNRGLSNLIVLTAMLLAAELCVSHAGLYGLIVNVPGLAVIWAAAHGAIRTGRDRRRLSHRAPDSPSRRGAADPALRRTRWASR